MDTYFMVSQTILPCNIFWDHKNTYPYKNSFEDECKGHMILNYLAKNCNV